jgi:hypothetical protein
MSGWALDGLACFSRADSAELSAPRNPRFRLRSGSGYMSTAMGRIYHKTNSKEGILSGDDGERLRAQEEEKRKTGAWKEMRELHEAPTAPFLLSQDGEPVRAAGRVPSSRKHPILRSRCARG